jgi:hypothetical protein
MPMLSGLVLCLAILDSYHIYSIKKARQELPCMCSCALFLLTCVLGNRPVLGFAKPRPALILESFVP